MSGNPWLDHLFEVNHPPHGFTFLIIHPGPPCYTIITPLHLSLIHFCPSLLPYYSVGKTTTLIKYNYSWILSIQLRNWPNLEKISSYTGWFCFQDKALISNSFQPCSTLPLHFPGQLILLLLENHLIILPPPHTHLMILILIFLGKQEQTKDNTASSHNCILTYMCLYKSRTCHALAPANMVNPPLNTLDCIPSGLL